MENAHSNNKHKKRTKRFLEISLTVVVLVGLSVSILIWELNNQPKFMFGSLELEIAADKPYYLQGENITFSIYAINSQNQSIAYPTRVTCEINRDSQPIGQINDKNIDYASGKIPIFHPNSRTLYESYVWNQKIYNQTILEPGNYTFTVFFDKNSEFESTNSCQFEIR